MTTRISSSGSRHSVASTDCQCSHHLHFIGWTPIMIDRTKARAYSPAVITEGGRIVWLAGMGGITDADGQPIVDFAGQTRRAFQNIDATLKQAGRVAQIARDHGCMVDQVNAALDRHPI